MFDFEARVLIGWLASTLRMPANQNGFVIVIPNMQQVWSFVFSLPLIYYLIC